MSKLFRVCMPSMIVALLMLLLPGNGQAQSKNTKSTTQLERGAQVYQAQIDANLRKIKSYEKALKQRTFLVEFKADGSFTMAGSDDVENLIQQQIRSLAAQGVIRSQRAATNFRNHTFASIQKNNDVNRLSMKNKIKSLKNTNISLKRMLTSGQKKIGQKKKTAASDKRPESRGRGLAGYKHTANAAINGHDITKLEKSSPADCARACDQKQWCVSFDYHKYRKGCDLSNKRASDVGGLRNTYPMNPYDHYARRQ